MSGGHALDSGVFWDLSAVSDLAKSLFTSDTTEPRSLQDAYRVDRSVHLNEPCNGSGATSVLGKGTARPDDKADCNDVALGSFKNLWKFLGHPEELSATDISILVDNREPRFLDDVTNSRGSNNSRQEFEVNGSGSADSALNGRNIAGTRKGKGRGEESSRNRRREAIQDLLGQPSTKKQACSSAQEKSDLISSYGVGLPKASATVVRGAKVPNAKPIHVQDGKTAQHGAVRSHGLGESMASKQALLSMLHDHFPGDRSFLEQRASPTAQAGSSPKAGGGLHIFVDLSNIVIGLQEAQKLADGRHATSYKRRPRLAFHNLSLILERGRPVAKRVLAGSDRIDAVREARLLGYEANILERVSKPPRPTDFGKHLTAGDGIASHASGAESSTGPRRNVEQGVDEILHLKIAESLIDAHLPGTIVLASGDAAAAEFGPGFLKMLERALERGWRVELAAFKSNLSRAYRKKAWKRRWKDKFSIIELDVFAEVLLQI